MADAHVVAGVPACRRALVRQALPACSGASGGGARNMRTLRQALVVATIVAMTASVAAAQSFTGGLRGAVKDANGVIPGVTVTLVNEATNQTREAVSNESGEYSFAA